MANGITYKILSSILPFLPNEAQQRFDEQGKLNLENERIKSAALKASQEPVFSPEDLGLAKPQTPEDVNNTMTRLFQGSVTGQESPTGGTIEQNPPTVNIPNPNVGNEIKNYTTAKYPPELAKVISEAKKNMRAKTEIVPLSLRSAYDSGNASLEELSSLFPEKNGNVEELRKKSIGEVIRRHDEFAALNRAKSTDVRQEKTLGQMQANQNQQASFKLNDDYVKASGDFPIIRDSFNRIKASATDPSAGGDLALIFNFMKLLDPKSVVRESEFATAANSGSVPDRIIALYNKVLNGERLADNIRKDFIDRSNKIYYSAVEQQRFTDKQFMERAKIMGVNPKTFILNQESATDESGRRDIKNNGGSGKPMDEKIDNTGTGVAGKTSTGVRYTVRTK